MYSYSIRVHVLCRSILRYREADICFLSIKAFTMRGTTRDRM